jgi:hypothetical protein
MPDGGTVTVAISEVNGSALNDPATPDGEYLQI